jgi:demethoxyubiquinone hydroxylase (CLK1/Coq7/Cat5 family)
VSDAREKLIRQLQGAYSGELAAGYAYRGHWHSVRDAAERERIQRIEAEEWHHRELVGTMLRDLGAAPNRRREAVFYCIGKVIAAICHVGGWFIPMYGAGRLEVNNIVEYENAAVYARECGHAELVDCLMDMAQTEWEHEKFFRERIAGHWMLRWLKPWEPPRSSPR